MTTPVEAQRAKILSAIEGQTLCTLFHQATTDHADADALGRRDDDGNWHWTSWGAYGQAAKHVAMALHKRGLGKGDFVAIMVENRPEHCIADAGSFMAAATGVSVYNTLAEDQIAYVAGNCEAKVAVLGGPEAYGRWAAVRDQLPELATIVVIEDADACDGEGVISWADFLAEGEAHLAEVGEEVYTERWNSVEPDDTATLIYTSGTTGPPKGVVETHQAVLYLMEAAKQVFELPMNPRVLSYLPLAHVAERTFSHWQGILYASKVFFCDDYTKIAEYLPVARPTAFLAVPRVWEKMRSALLNRVAEAEGPKAKLGQQAFEILPQLGGMQLTGRKPSILLQAQATLFERLVYSKVREGLGMDDLTVALTGAAKMPDDLLMFFSGLGIEILNVYGMTETCAVTNANQPGRTRLSTVGEALPGIEVAIADDGEIIARGPTMTPAYYKRPEATEELYDDDGWLHTGDLGRISEGYLEIIGRKKEIIVTSSGKNVSPHEIETHMTAHPLIGQVMAVGDDRNYISALLVLDPEAAPGWAAKNDIPYESLAEFSQREDVRAEIERAVETANTKLARVEQVKRWELLPTDWTVESGELTPSMKLKRHVVETKYADVIEGIYA
ncbi:AMP-dependent synthetase/ligase [Euzebya tangerina]|uniref:AMP-dependent synthetase/ligase n=1 Tax=Euzebya tangerina TaxID=591198 RepID=UPI0013C2D336|nr:AMP-dependent synthetase/ligase [Euzebya tangerina]